MRSGGNTMQVREKTFRVICVLSLLNNIEISLILKLVTVYIKIRQLFEREAQD